MKEYRCEVPRVAFGLAALAMSTLTIGALVELPSRIEGDGHSDTVMTAARVNVAQCVATLPEHPTRSAN